MGQLSADLGMHLVGQDRIGSILAKRYRSLSLRKAGDTTLPLEADSIGIWWIRVFQMHLALELGLHWSNRRSQCEVVFRRRYALDRLAAVDARLENVQVIEAIPDTLLGSGDALLAAHVHAISPCSF